MSSDSTSMNTATGKPTNHRPAGTLATRRFYDQIGWRQVDGKAVDLHLFGVREDGPIRKELHKLRMDRVRSTLSKLSSGIRLLECGCGSSPATTLLDLCCDYTGVDFSGIGLQLARPKLDRAEIPFRLSVADACQLPFPDGSFDAVYSAHMIYHIEDPQAQRAALNEMLRVVRPGGIVVLIVANARPLLFPVQLIRRLIADTPVVGPFLNRHRAKPPLPYRPMPLGWMKRRLSRSGPVEILSHGLPTTAFNQRTTEYAGWGQILWNLIRWIDVNFPRASAYLGYAAQITVSKRQIPTSPANAADLEE